MLSVIRNVSVQKKIFASLFYKLNHNRNVPMFYQHLRLIKFSIQPLRICTTVSPSSPSETKYYDSSERANFLDSLHYTLDENLTLEDFQKLDLALIWERFGLKGLSIQCIQKYNMRVSPDFTTVFFPFDSMDKKVSAIQTMKYNETDEQISLHLSAGTEDLFLFGWSLVDSQDKTLVITSDPLDAIAVNQVSDVAAVALPHNFSKFSPDLLSVLNEFPKVIFWMRPHLHDWESHKRLGSALKDKGYYIRSSEYNNPMYCLQNGPHLKQILRDSHPLYDRRLETFETYEDSIYEELRNPEKVSGLKWKRFAALNDLLKGLRKGELTIFSGQTGTGKTTFMSEYSLDLCSQGLPTLWASFETTNTRLLKTMLCQFSKCSPDEIIPYGEWSEKFKKLPLNVLNFHSCHSLDGILSAMLSAVHLYEIQHIVVDNLQFMMNMDDYNSTIDQLRRQDQIFAAFREFATHWKCHITLVIHPRKEPEFSELNITSISGTAKATQEADNVIILQTTKSRQYLQVTKNRFDGDKGCVVLDFDKRTFSYTMKKLSVKNSDANSTL